jgi:hypothetical protein
MHRTLEAVIIGEKLTAIAGDFMHPLCPGVAVSHRCPKTPKQQQY